VTGNVNQVKPPDLGETVLVLEKSMMDNRMLGDNDEMTRRRRNGFNLQTKLPCWP
jgi:hypothetical protein